MAKYLSINKDNTFRNEYLNYEEGCLTELGEVSNINLLIGANNSRKSRFVRALLKLDKYNLFSEKVDGLLEKLEDALKPFINSLKKDESSTLKILKKQRSSEELAQRENVKALYNIINSDIERNIRINNEYFILFIDTLRQKYDTSDFDLKGFKSIIESHKHLIYFLISCSELRSAMNNSHYFYSFSYLSNELYKSFELLHEAHSILEILASIEFKSYSPNKIYIPTLRAAISIYLDSSDKATSDIFKSTILKNYGFNEKEQNLEIITGLDLFNKIKRSRNSIRETRNKFAAFETFLKKNFFDNKEIDIVALEEESTNEEHIKIYIEGENDRDLHDLGDGVQSLIILLHPIFMAEEGTWIFIEEPELNMHPGLQHIFLRTLLFDKFLKKKNLRYFITTHSNNLLNLSLNFNKFISVFTFEKLSQKNSSVSKITQVVGNDTKILELLGVYNSSVFMSNCSIWVEGVSDRRYLKAFLLAYIRDNYQKTYQEDLHFSFFEYAGTNLQHYLFNEEDDSPESLDKIKAHFLSNKIFLLADQDKAPWKQERHKVIKSWIKDKFHYETTVALEIENTLSANVLKMIVNKVLKVEVAIVNTLNLIEEDYLNIGLGEFLNRKLTNKVQKLPKFRDKGGTLKPIYKEKFSKYVLEGVESENIKWADICKNEHAKNLTESLYHFIESHNSSF
ncbi:MAG: hypothetical protein COW65_05875 [Cytophagales bacterium CG18_big_fil_WC_8_21_14_2_50_42_9]|nr:MAG: hypothetical protein COW65_05875 [Cytophagales bacterium CG18_big_fil_WC_8_21_14_2_50_42_9]